jgi:hypothetical protein
MPSLLVDDVYLETAYAEPLLRSAGVLLQAFDIVSIFRHGRGPQRL